MRNQYVDSALQARLVPWLSSMMCVWAMVSHDNFMWIWIGFWLLCQLKRRVESVKLARSGAWIHSQYDGWPFDAIKYARTEKVAKMVVEPILVGILGGILYWIYSQYGLKPTGLPYFFLSGIFTLPFVEIVKQTIWEKKIRGMQDARLEQEQMVEELRDKWGN